ncbi:MAG: hypothetical protein DME42_00700 [Verrucomicrobia bacterium]|nr:MAG: hypothetical protein DME42_00700 [Verrucomicrobiota bacterium]
MPHWFRRNQDGVLGIAILWGPCLRSAGGKERRKMSNVQRPLKGKERRGKGTETSNAERRTPNAERGTRNAE